MADRLSNDAETLAAAQALLKAGDAKAAERLLAEPAARADAPLDVRTVYGRVLLRLDRGGDALEVARLAVKRFPKNVWAHTFLGETLVKLDAVSEAERVLAEALQAFPDVAALHALHAQSARLTGDLPRALGSIDNALARAPEKIEFQLRRAILLAAAGRLSEAEDIRSAIEDSAPALLSIYGGWIYAAQRLGHQSLAMTFCENAIALMPSQGRPWLWRAELLIAGDNADDALAALDKSTRSNEPMSEDDAFRYARAKGRALRLAKDKEAAIAAFQQSLALRAKDQTTLRDLYVLHLQTGRDEEMRDYGRKLESVVAQKLPERLGDGLARLRGRKPPPGLMDERARWAWEIADRSVWSQEAWLEALYWGQNADQLLRDWWLSAQARGSEIDALIDRPSNTEIDALPAGAKCLCVTTHMGPLAASVRYLQTCGRPYRGFGYAGPDPVVDGEPPMRIAAKGNSSLRELMSEIEKGTLIGFAAESPETHRPLNRDFLGRPITLSTLVPRIIFKLRTRSIWWHALWRDGRIVMEMDRLPDPEQGEPLDDWCRRWFDAYLERVAHVMQGRPENLNLGHGIWRNVGDD